jgi:hypothetical protein
MIERDRRYLQEILHGIGAARAKVLNREAILRALEQRFDTLPIIVPCKDLLGIRLLWGQRRVEVGVGGAIIALGHQLNEHHGHEMTAIGDAVGPQVTDSSEEVQGLPLRGGYAGCEVERGAIGEALDDKGKSQVHEFLNVCARAPRGIGSNDAQTIEGAQLRIPTQIDHAFQFKSSTDSGANRPLIPG